MLATLRAAEPDYGTVTIASGASVSDAVDLHGRGLIRVFMPTGWDAASITFQESENGATWSDVYDDAGTEVALTVAASRAIVVDPAQFPSVKWLRLRSGTSAVPVNQTADRALRLASRGL